MKEEITGGWHRPENYTINEFIWEKMGKGILKKGKEKAKPQLQVISRACMGKSMLADAIHHS